MGTLLKALVLLSNKRHIIKTMGCVGLLMATLHSPFLKAQQNFVNNGSLEVRCNPFPNYNLYDDRWWTCDSSWMATGYQCFSSLFPSSYYFSSFMDSAGNFISFRAPLNQCGYRKPHSGYGYIGITLYWDLANNMNQNLTQNNRAILQQTLSTPLRAGQRYLMEFFTVLADSSQYSCNRLGMGF